MSRNISDAASAPAAGFRMRRDCVGLCFRSKDKASDVASSYAESVSSIAGDARRAVSESSDRFRRQAQGTLQTTMDRVLREQPLAVAMLGAAAGAAVAAAFPATEVENRMLGGTHDAISNAVDQAGKSVMGAASKATERLKSAVEERGFTADGLKDLAGEVAESFTDAVSGKSEAKSGMKSGAASGGSSSGTRKAATCREARQQRLAGYEQRQAAVQGNEWWP